MVPDCRKCNKALAELDCRRELLKNSIKECVSIRDHYILRNEENQKELKRLVDIKENLTYMKDVLLQDLYKSNISAGTRRQLLSKRVEEFQEKNHAMKLRLENLPGASQLHELMQSNDKLLAVSLKSNEMLENAKKEYSTVFHVLENDFKMKIIEFSEELSKIMKGKIKRDTPLFQ